MNKIKKTFNKNRVLILVRGVPGSGKSTFAEILARPDIDKIFTADAYFEDEKGNYNWNPSKIGDAHKFCQENVEKSLMNNEQLVIVANTSVSEKEVNIYQNLAKKYDYEFISVIVENRNGTTSIHGVPQETILKMVKNFNIKL